MTTDKTGGPNGDLEIVRRDLYPIDRLASPEGRALVEPCRAQIDSQGYCILPDFVTPEALARMAALSRAVARPQARQPADLQWPPLAVPGD